MGRTAALPVLPLVAVAAACWSAVMATSQSRGRPSASIDHLVPPRHFAKAPPERHATGVVGAVGSIDAAAFGVRADGRSDDTLALQSAISAAAGAATVLLPAGTMVVTRPLMLETSSQWAPGLKLQGQGKGVTVLDNRVANGACIVARSTTLYHFQLGGWITHLTINASTHAPNSSGISVEAVYNFHVDSVQIDGLSGDGMTNTNHHMDGDGAVELQLTNSWVSNNAGYGFNSDFGMCTYTDQGKPINGCKANVQSSFATFKNNYFAGNGNGTKPAVRYMGLQGTFQGNGFTTNRGGGLLVDYGGSNNAQLTMIDNDFENNGYPSLNIRSVIAARIIGTGIAQTVWKEFPSTGGIVVGNQGIAMPKWQVIYNLVFQDTYLTEQRNTKL